MQFTLLTQFQQTKQHKNLRNLQCVSVIILDSNRNQRFLELHSKVKRKALAYSQALRLIKGVFKKGSPWYDQVQILKG